MTLGALIVDRQGRGDATSSIRSLEQRYNVYSFLRATAVRNSMVQAYGARETTIVEGPLEGGTQELSRLVSGSIYKYKHDACNSYFWRLFTCCIDQHLPRGVEMNIRPPEAPLYVW